LLDHIFNLEGLTDKMRETIVFINHGETNRKSVFEESIRNRASLRKHGDRRIADIQIADGKWFNLDSGCYEDGPNPEDELRDAMVEKGLSAEDVKKLIEQLS
ncbi:hypothetical protein, partial [Marinobacter salarius]